MEGVKQDMPPCGGFKPITYERIPLKKYLPASAKWLILGGIFCTGCYFYSQDKKRVYYNGIEKRSARLSILPLLMAENDRIRLRQCREMRDLEADIMKDVEGWEVGKINGERVYKTLDPDEWYEPSYIELWALCHPNHVKKSVTALKYY